MAHHAPAGKNSERQQVAACGGAKGRVAAGCIAADAYGATKGRVSADSIAAIATPPGAGGVGVIRISGGDLRSFSALLSCAFLPPPRMAMRVRFVDADGAAIDDGLALYFPAPRSFTGESVLELHAHGGVFVLRQLLSRCIGLGARQAEPGEFTLRAYLNGKLDLSQAEAVADLISAGSAAAARAAAQSLRGAFSAETERLASRAATLRAALEGGLDFVDDDAQTPPPEQTAAALGALAEELNGVLRRASRGALLAGGVAVVIAGAPNVGKSSLLNRLANEEAAIVAPQAGTTRDVVQRQIIIDGVPLTVADVAGLRDAKDAVEQQGVARARAKLADADVALSVETADAPPPPELAAGDSCTAAGGNATRVRVFNKIDLSGEAAGERDGILYVSAKTGEGLDALRTALLRAAGGQQGIIETPFSARARHITALEQAAEYLRRATADAALPEVAAAWLRDAQAALTSISGNNGNDEEELLGNIFSRFCVGK